MWGKSLKLDKVKRILKDKKCAGCGTLFRPKNSLRKFCSYSCSSTNRPKKGITRKCPTCGKHPKELAKFKKWTWKHFSDYIRERDDWTCYTCDKYDKSPAMHAGHFVSRVRAATLFDEMNVHAQCYGCNIGKKGNAGEYSYRLIKQYGQEAFDDLVLRSRSLHKFTHDELEEIYKSAKERRKELLNKNI